MEVEPCRATYVDEGRVVGDGLMRKRKTQQRRARDVVSLGVPSSNEVNEFVVVDIAKLAKVGCESVSIERRHVRCSRH
jgi:hypothetical protein